MLSPSLILNLVIGCGVISVLYGFIASKQILSASPGNAKMQEIAAAIQIGAKAYLDRQYKTIAMVGFAVLILIYFLFNEWVGLGYLIGATLSGIAGYVGMLISVQANVRTAEASRKGLAQGKLDGLQHLAIIKGTISEKNIPKVRVLSSNSIDIFLNKSINDKVKKTLNFFKKTPNCVLLIIREGDLSDMPKTFSSKNIKKNATKENSLRYYGVGAQILKNLKIKKMILVSSAKKRLVALDGFGIKITKQEILK